MPSGPYLGSIPESYSEFKRIMADGNAPASPEAGLPELDTHGTQALPPQGMYSMALSEVCLNKDCVEAARYSYICPFLVTARYLHAGSSPSKLLAEAKDRIGSLPLCEAAERYPIEAWRVWMSSHPVNYTEDSEVCMLVPLSMRYSRPCACLSSVKPWNLLTCLCSIVLWPISGRGPASCCIQQGAHLSTPLCRSFRRGSRTS